MRIKNLVKRYGANKVPAVNNLSLSTFQNELLVLLGHNGAGKTTTISCLSGLVKPTTGSATAFGLDIFNKPEEAADFLGVCPQDDVLLEKMSVIENLKFFSEFKGMDIEEANSQINLMLKKFGMDNKK